MSQKGMGMMGFGWGWEGDLETHSLRQERSRDFALRTVEQCSLYWFFYAPGLIELFHFSEGFDTFLAHGHPNMLFALLRKLSFFSYHLAGANATFISQLKCHLKWQWPCLTAARVTSYQILLNLLLLFLGGTYHGKHKLIACLQLLYFQHLLEPRYFQSILKLKNKCKN